METFKTSDEIEAWQQARTLAGMVCEASGKWTFGRDFALRDRIRRAAVSVMSNIAEGFGRGGAREFGQFLSVARGSASEVSAQLYVALIRDTSVRRASGNCRSRRLGPALSLAGWSDTCEQRD
jgi:four helix bundle protein